MATRSLFGAEYGDQTTANARFDNVFVDSNTDRLTIAFSDPLNIPSFGFTSAVRNRASDVTFTSVYLQDQISLTENFKLVLGGRYDRFEIDVDDAFSTDNDGQFSRTDTEFTPRLGVIYKPAENVSFYASYSETFLPQSGEQFLTLNLDSESTRPQFFENKEIGAKWDINDRLSLTTAIFELDRESFTSVDPNDPGEPIIVEGSETTGFEVQLSGEVTERWFLSTGYSYLDGEVSQVEDPITGDNGNDGNKTRQTPEHNFSIWNNVKVTEVLEVGIGATYQDSFFVREDNSVEVPSYIRFDAAAYYTLNDTTRLQLNVENLFNTDYYPDAHSNDNISTGEPLNVRFSISTRF